MPNFTPMEWVLLVVFGGPIALSIVYTVLVYIPMMIYVIITNPNGEIRGPKQQ